MSLTAPEMPAEASSADCRWSIAEAGRDSLDLREWGDEYVVYLKTQAATHLLDGATGAVLKALLRSQHATSINELASLSFGTVDESAPAALSADECAALESILFELRRIGVAQAHPS